MDFKDFRPFLRDFFPCFWSLGCFLVSKASLTGHFGRFFKVLGGFCDFGVMLGHFEGFFPYFLGLLGKISSNVKRFWRIFGSFA